MMGNSRTGHIQQGSDIDHTFLLMTKQPEDLQPCGITQLFKYLGSGGKA